MHFELAKNDMVALNNEDLAKFEIPATPNRKRGTANCSLRFAVSHEKPNAKGLK